MQRSRYPLLTPLLFLVVLAPCLHAGAQDAAFPDADELYRKYGNRHDLHKAVIENDAQRAQSENAALSAAEAVLENLDRRVYHELYAAEISSALKAKKLTLSEAQFLLNSAPTPEKAQYLLATPVEAPPAFAALTPRVQDILAAIQTKEPDPDLYRSWMVSELARYGAAPVSSPIPQATGSTLAIPRVRKIIPGAGEALVSPTPAPPSSTTATPVPGAPPIPETPREALERTLANKIKQQDANSGAQDPTPHTVGRLEAGYLANRIKNGKNALYYNVEYDGRPLKTKNQPFTFVNPNAPLADLPVADLGDGSGDTNNFSFRLERGTVTSDGPLAEFLARKPLKLGGAFKNLRGTAQVIGQVDRGPLNLALGLETRPWHPLALINRTFRSGITNWLILGLSGQTDLKANDMGDDSALFTYRTFAGRGFGWVRSERLTNITTNEILEQAPDYKTMLSKAGELETDKENSSLTKIVLMNTRDRVQLGLIAAEIRATVGANGLTPAEAHKLVVEFPIGPGQLGGALRGEPGIGAAVKSVIAARPATKEILTRILENALQSQPTQEDYEATVRDAVKYFNLPPDQPTNAIYLETNGWYNISHKDISGKRFNNLISLRFQHWLDARKKGDQWISLTYQVGRDRAAADDRKSFLAATMGVNF